MVCRFSPFTTNEPACRLVFLCPEFLFCPLLPPVSSQCLYEFKALKALFRTVAGTATSYFALGRWVRGALGSWVDDHVGKNNNGNGLVIGLAASRNVMGKREGGTLPISPHGSNPLRNSRPSCCPAGVIPFWVGG